MILFTVGLVMIQFQEERGMIILLVSMAMTA